jgi:hypothetical protein
MTTTTSAPQSESARARIARWLLLSSAALLFAIAILTAIGYVPANIALRNSGIQPLYHDLFRAMWLGFAVETLLIAALAWMGARKPAAAANWVLAACGWFVALQALLALILGKHPLAAIALAVAAVLLLVGAAFRKPAA